MNWGPRTNPIANVITARARVKESTTPRAKYVHPSRRQCLYANLTSRFPFAICACINRTSTRYISARSRNYAPRLEPYMGVSSSPPTHVTYLLSYSLGAFPLSGSLTSTLKMVERTNSSYRGEAKEKLMSLQRVAFRQARMRLQGVSE